MYNILVSTQFKKDLKLITKRNYDLNLLKNVIDLLDASGQLPQQYKTHLLKGKYSEHLECHIKPDWLLIWIQDDIKLEITLLRTGTHSDLFD